MTSDKFGDTYLWMPILSPEEYFEKYTPSKNGKGQVSSTSLPIGNVDVDDSCWWVRFGAKRLIDMGEPKPPKYLVHNFVEQGQPTYIYGGRGTLKSIDALALAIGIASPEVHTVLGYAVENHGPVVVFDSELNEEKFNQRSRELCSGLGIAVPPDIYYKNAVGVSPKESFPALHELARRAGAVAVVIDSWGFATRGNPEDYGDVRNDTANYLNPLIAEGIAPIVVEHKPHQGNHLFGSVAKEYHGRFIFRVEDLDKDEREKGVRNTRLINEKASFTEEGQKTTLVTRFEANKIRIENVDADVDTPHTDTSAPAMVVQALSEGDKTRAEIALFTGYTKEYLANLLPRMVSGKTLYHHIYHVGNKGKEYIYSLNDQLSSTSTLPIDSDVDDSEPGEENTAPAGADKTTREHGSGLIVDDSAALSEMVSQVQQSPGPIGLDVETYPQDDTARSIDPRRGKVAVISISAGSNTYVVDAKKLPPDTIRTALEECLPNKPLIAHNAPFDLAFLRRAFGYEHDGPVYDTLVLDAMLFYATGPLTEKKGWKGFTTRDKDAGYKRSLKDAVQHRLGLELDKTEQSSDWAGELTPEMVSYATADAEILIQLRDALVSELGALGMDKVVDLEARFTPAMAYASDNGFALDVDGWKKHAADAQAAIEQALEDCNKLAPEVPEGVDEWKWNASNHRKVGLALETLGATVRKSPKGNYKTDEDALKGIRKPARAKRLAEAILRYRTNEKYVTTWGENWFREPWLNTKGRVHQNSPDHLMVVDGRVHAKFNQLVASGRGSSKQPNMQNLPPEIRHYFVASPGRRLLIADYSQLEYVAAAHLAGDEALLEPLREGRDFHQVTAEMIGTDRSRAKMVNFGVLYGMGTKALANKLGTTEGKAWDYREKLWKRAPKLRTWGLQQERKAYDAEPLATTSLGRRRLIDVSRRVPYGYREGQEHLLGLWEGNRSQLLNHPIQGACAEGYKLAGALIWERRKEFKGNPLLVNLVHDEFVLEVDEGTAESDAVLLETLMLEGMREVLGDAPVSVDVKVADHWGEKN